MIGQSFNTSLFFIKLEGCEFSPTINFPFLRNFSVSFCVKLNDLSMAPISVICMTSTNLDFAFPSRNLLNFPELTNIWCFEISILNQDNASVRASYMYIINSSSIAITCTYSDKFENIFLIGSCV